MTTHCHGHLQEHLQEYNPLSCTLAGIQPIVMYTCRNTTHCHGHIKIRKSISRSFHLSYIENIIELSILLNYKELFRVQDVNHSLNSLTIGHLFLYQISNGRFMHKSIE